MADRKHVPAKAKNQVTETAKAAPAPQAAARSTDSCPGPTPLGIGKPEDIVAGAATSNNEVFWIAQDRNGPAKAALQFDTTPALARPYPHLLLIGVRPDGQSYALNVPTVVQSSSITASFV